MKPSLSCGAPAANAAEITHGRIDVSIEYGVGRFVLDNPRKLNAMSADMWHALVAALDAHEHDPGLRCIVIAARGDKAFCVGADISQLEADGNEDAAAEYDRIAKAAIRRLEAFSKPTIAMISGYCLGAGVALAIACDLRIAGAGARFGIPAARLGIGYYFDGIRRLTDLIGPSRTKQMMFTAAKFEADEMLRAGLIDELFPTDSLAARVDSMANAIAANAPLTIAAAKYAVDTAFRDPQERDLAECAAREAACMTSHDYVEGRRAFLEKRAPRFEGR